LIDAIEAGDATAYAAPCTEHVQLLHADSPLITGRQELEAHNAAIFDAVSAANLDLTPLVVCGVGDLT
jgi:ketosteroid isomerase-like protein